MKWRRHGVVWRPDGQVPWALSHATCPTPLLRADGSLRVYVQCRDHRNVGRVGYVDLDPDDPRRVLRVAKQPVLDIGEAGGFDDNGVFQTSVLALPDGRLFMYYVGFELCTHIPYRLLTGLAISEDGGEHFVRVRSTPILERSPEEPHFRCGPGVRIADGRFRMWYVAGGAWEVLNGKPLPVYDMRFIESDDGVHWPEAGEVVLSLRREREHGFGRPWVQRDADGYRMHYSIRQREPARHTLGLARSADGRAWRRVDDELGLEPDGRGWDGDSMCFGAEVSCGGRTWLFYNGNQMGATGFGVAELLKP